MPIIMWPRAACFDYGAMREAYQYSLNVMDEVLEEKAGGHGKQYMSE